MTNYEECVNIFSKNFSSYHSGDNSNMRLNELGDNFVTNYNNLHISTECVEEKLSTIDAAKSSGPDKIHLLNCGIFPDY